MPCTILCNVLEVSGAEKLQSRTTRSIHGLLCGTALARRAGVEHGARASTPHTHVQFRSKVYPYTYDMSVSQNRYSFESSLATACGFVTGTVDRPKDVIHALASTQNHVHKGKGNPNRTSRNLPVGIGLSTSGGRTEHTHTVLIDQRTPSRVLQGTSSKPAPHDFRSLTVHTASSAHRHHSARPHIHSAQMNNLTTGTQPSAYLCSRVVQLLATVLRMIHGIIGNLR